MEKLEIKKQSRGMAQRLGTCMSSNDLELSCQVQLPIIPSLGNPTSSSAPHQHPHANTQTCIRIVESDVNIVYM